MHQLLLPERNAPAKKRGRQSEDLQVQLFLIQVFALISLPLLPSDVSAQPKSIIRMTQVGQLGTTKLAVSGLLHLLFNCLEREV